MQKTCRSCGETKLFAEFNKRAESADGHTPWCKNCVAIKRKGASHGITGSRTEVPEEHKQSVYLGAILRMKNSGLVSDRTAREMATRVGDL